jgi:hypothetical protein
MDRLRQQGSDLVYRCAKQHSEPIAGVGARQAELVLTPLELIDRIATSAGYTISINKRKLIEQGFGWGKMIGRIRQVMVRVRAD